MGAPELGTHPIGPRLAMALKDLDIPTPGMDPGTEVANTVRVVVRITVKGLQVACPNAALIVKRKNRRHKYILGG